MRLYRSVPSWVWGVGLTLAIVVAVLVYGNDNQDENDRKESPESSSVTAGSDPPSLRKSKANLDRDIRAYVRAFMSKRPGMTQTDYVERIKPLETADHLVYFKQYIGTPIEQDLIERGATVRVVIIDEIEGELHGDADKRRFEGIVPLKLIMMEEDVRSVLMPRTSFHLQMVESPERWQATYFAPVTR